MDIVIGGSGFIGSHLVRELARRGNRIRVFDCKPFPDEEGTAPHEMVLGDILDYPALYSAVEGCSTVYHLAGNPQLWDRHPANFDRVNRQGTENVIRAVRQAGAGRLIYTGTESTLVPRRHKGPVTEDTRTVLRDMAGPYCRSKFLAEQAVMELAAEGFPAVVVCPTLPIGPGDRNLTPPGRMICDFLQGKIPGFINCTLNFVDARDAAVGHVLAAERGRPGQRYILSGYNLTLNEFFSCISEASGRPVPGLRVPYAVALAWSHIEEWVGRVTGRTPQSSVTGVKLCRRSLSFDGSRTWKQLGHTIRPLEESIRDSVLWFQKHVL